LHLRRSKINEKLVRGRPTQGNHRNAERGLPSHAWFHWCYEKTSWVHPRKINQAVPNFRSVNTQTAIAGRDTGNMRPCKGAPKSGGRGSVDEWAKL